MGLSYWPSFGLRVLAMLAIGALFQFGPHLLYSSYSSNGHICSPAVLACGSFGVATDPAGYPEQAARHCSRGQSDNAFPILATSDGGPSWQPVTCDVMPLAGEEAFAASNDSLTLNGKSKIAIGLSGRADSGAIRLLLSADSGNNWSVTEIAAMPANASSGMLAVEIRENGFGIAVGGDY